MKFAFCLFKYFPYGGLQRDFLRIAKACLANGHDIHVYTMAWQGDQPPGISLHLLPQHAWQNHRRILQFAQRIQHETARKDYDLVVGFNKMPYLDAYYAADVCYQARIRKKYGNFYRFIPRCRQLVAFEKAVFAEGLNTEILLISPHQQAEFEQYYHTEHSRFHMLPPGISQHHLKTISVNEKNALRQALGVSATDKMLLMVGSGFKTKGLDRSIRALAALPDKLKAYSHLYVVGQDRPDRYISLAKKLAVPEQVHFLGGREDVSALMQSADLLLHPAYHENTGTVLLEAMVCGLPVLTVDVCGYAHFVYEAQAGKVLASPFEQDRLNHALQEMLSTTDRALWSANAVQFSLQADIYNMPEVAAKLLEKFAEKKRAVFAS